MGGWVIRNGVEGTAAPGKRSTRIESLPPVCPPVVTVRIAPCAGSRFAGSGNESQKYWLFGAVLYPMVQLLLLQGITPATV